MTRRTTALIAILVTQLIMDWLALIFMFHAVRQEETASQFFQVQTKLDRTLIDRVNDLEKRMGEEVK